MYSLNLTNNAFIDKMILITTGSPLAERIYSTREPDLDDTSGGIVY